MFETFRNIFTIPDLRKRILYTFGLLAIYRIGAHIPTPGVNPKAMAEFFASQAAGALGLLDIFSGGALRRFSVFALGIMPYISASIILQLLTVVWPYLDKLQKEGEIGRKKITQYTRWGTVALSVVQAAGIGLFLEKQQLPSGQYLVRPELQGGGFMFLTIVGLTTGSIFIMWLGEQISDRGIGNGISLLIYAGIVVGLPSGINDILRQVQLETLSLFAAIIIVVFMVLIVAFIVFMESGHRRIPIQYAKRVVGRKVYGGQNTYLPLRVNVGGVMAIIFAISIIQFPRFITNFTSSAWAKSLSDSLAVGHPIYVIFYAIAIVFFTYFYTSIVFNPDDTADNIRKYGGFIPGIRPGKNTAEYIDNSLTRITAVATIYLIAIAILPDFLSNGFKVGGLPGIGPALEAALPKWVTEGFGFNFYFGGTSLLIVVGVAMDTVQQIESQLVMRHYDGFLKKSRARGRRS